MATKVLSFVAAVNSRKLVKLNNEKIRSVTNLVCISLCEISAFYEKEQIYRVVFSEFWFKWLEGKQDLCILVPKMVDRWP